MEVRQITFRIISNGNEPNRRTDPNKRNYSTLQGYLNRLPKFSLSMKILLYFQNLYQIYTKNAKHVNKLLSKIT